jgi:pimeloyl-ACP methyl ester carboxylesterase
MRKSKKYMLRYRLEGCGATPLLLIHGWGVTFAIWQNLAPLLTSSFRLIMIELPGIGGSPESDPKKPYYESCAEAIDEIRVALGIEQWLVLAYSSGTRAAEAYVRRYPQTIIRAVLLCPIYLQEIWSFFLHLLDSPHPETINTWIFSDWRLHNLIRGLGFNWQRHDYTYTWKNEIELQPIDILIRSLCEIPGKGRAPFDLPAVPTLFVWGRKDALTATPRHLRPNDILIPANHSAPMLAAEEVAQAVLPFLMTGELLVKQEQEFETAENYSIWHVLRSIRLKQKIQPVRSRKEIRLSGRPGTKKKKMSREVGKASRVTKQRRLLSQPREADQCQREELVSSSDVSRKTAKMFRRGRARQRKDKARSATKTSRKRLFLSSKSRKCEAGESERRHPLRWMNHKERT